MALIALSFIILINIFLFPASFHLYSDTVFILIVVIFSLLILETITLVYRKEIDLKKYSGSSGFFDKKNVPYVFLSILTSALLLRFLLGPMRTGARIDEFYHLFSGLNIMKEGSTVQVYNNSPGYKRGLYVSYLLAVSFRLLGKNIFAARLVPFLVGGINLVISYLLAKKVTNRLVATISLVVIAFEPMMIFIHTYIREYVFIQFFVLFSLFILFKLRESYFDEDSSVLSKTNLLLLSSIIALNAVGLLFTNSFNKYSVFIVIFLFVTFFLLEIFKEKLFSLSQKKKVILLLIAVSSLSFLIFWSASIQKLLLGVIFVEGVSITPGNFTFILLIIYGAFLPLFVIGASTSFLEKNIELLYLVGIFTSIYLIFDFLDMKRMVEGRFIAFILPLFFIIASRSIPVLMDAISSLMKRSDLSISKRATFTYILTVMIIIAAIFSTYPVPKANEKPTLRGPSYKDWGKSTSYLKENVEGDDTVISIPAHGAEFYGPKPDYTIMTQDWDYASSTTGMRNGEDVYLMTGTPVLNSTEEINEIFNESDRVWIVYSSDYLSRWTDDEIVNLVENNTNRVEESKDWADVTLLLYESD